MFNEKIGDIIEQIAQNYNEEFLAFDDPNRHFPSRVEIIEMLKDLQRVLFPRYFGTEAPCGAGPHYFIGETLTRIEQRMHPQVREALLFRDGASKFIEQIEEETSNICSDFFYQLPELQRRLFKDVQAAFDGDPAAQSKQEIILAYPGLFAIFVYRIAHILYGHKVPLIPRLMTEYAHSKTGVDINAGATIGEYFFIDHATGVVIGETTTIGSHVKIYQGVTLGALSTRKGQQLAGVKRHPTIEDDVTIYSNASVLGGQTVVGKGAIIAGSAFVTESVPAYARVSLKNQEVVVRTRSDAKPAQPVPAPTWEI